MEARHRLTFETHEEGKLTFEKYLGWLVFYQKRPFTRAQFRRCMCAQSKSRPEMIELMTQLKIRHGLKIAEGLGFKAYFTQITSPPARNWLHSD